MVEIPIASLVLFGVSAVVLCYSTYCAGKATVLRQWANYMKTGVMPE